MRRFVNVAMIHCERYSPLQLGGFFFKCYLIVTFAELTVTKVVCLVLVHQKRLFKFITLLIDFGACFSSLVSMGSESKLCTGKTEDQCYMFKFLKTTCFNNFINLRVFTHRLQLCCCCWITLSAFQGLLTLFYASGSLQCFYQCCNFLCALANPYLKQQIVK